jgi:citrate synthase
MVWEGSVLDANEGIRFHGRTIKDCQKELPKGTTGTEMLPEAMFWLLLTGEVPTTSQVRVLSRELAEKAQLPDFVTKMLDNFPKDLHPMTQFACAVSALNHTSVFAKAYEKGLNKADYWEPTYEDSISLLAKLPTIAAKIYQNAYRGGGPLPAEIDLSQDWSYNFAAMLGKGGEENVEFQDLLRLYLALHGDHEGGNVSAHTTHLVGSALSAAFLSYSAGLLGQAGPLHGLAAQEVLRWILQMKEAIPASPSADDVKNYLWSTLKSGRVIPGYGHGVLRKPDPRFEALMDFAAARPHIAKDPVFQLVKMNSEIAPGVLKEHGKVCNSSINTKLEAKTHRYYTDQEPIPERRLQLWRPLPLLWLQGDSILHCHLWCLPWPRPACTAHLGPCSWSADRAPEEHQLARSVGQSRCVNVLVPMLSHMELAMYSGGTRLYIDLEQEKLQKVLFLVKILVL